MKELTSAASTSSVSFLFEFLFLPARHASSSRPVLYPSILQALRFVTPCVCDFGPRSSNRSPSSPSSAGSPSRPSTNIRPAATARFWISREAPSSLGRSLRRRGAFVPLLLRRRARDNSISSSDTDHLTLLRRITLDRRALRPWAFLRNHDGCLGPVFLVDSCRAVFQPNPLAVGHAVLCARVASASRPLGIEGDDDQEEAAAPFVLRSAACGGLHVSGLSQTYHELRNDMNTRPTRPKGPTTAAIEHRDRL